ncbi:hypothetical protein MJ585_22810 [Klebsiella pneumoniae]|nr:hypothetical protein MJ585_22810 [Klebsiella pneumoniae]
MWMSPNAGLVGANGAGAVRRQPFVASTLLGATTMTQLQANVESLQQAERRGISGDWEAVHQVIPTRRRKKQSPG